MASYCDEISYFFNEYIILKVCWYKRSNKRQIKLLLWKFDSSKFFSFQNLNFAERVLLLIYPL